MTSGYDLGGRLPIHDAAFRDYDTIVARIIESAAQDEDKDDENDDNRTEDEKEQENLLRQGRIQEVVEAITYDSFRLTPILAATIGDARRTIECLVSYGARVTCRDGDNRSMAAITILKQNVDLFIYLSQAPYSNELDLWKTLMNMFTSKSFDESAAAGRILEQLTLPKTISKVWPQLSKLSLIEKTIQILVRIVKNNENFNNASNSNEQLLTSCLLIIYNLMFIDLNIRTTFCQNDDGAEALVKMRKTNNTLTLLFTHLAEQLCEDTRCIHAFVKKRLIEEIDILLGIDTRNLSQTQACLYFEILTKIARCKSEYQTLIYNSSTKPGRILDRAIDLLERDDRYLTISIFTFIRELCFGNERQQQICAENLSIIKHLLHSLNSPHKDVQRGSVETLQIIVTHNAVSQMTILKLGGAEQLLLLLRKATLPKLRISIVCTLWSLTENDSSRRQFLAHEIGVGTLVEFLHVKSAEQLYCVLDVTSELLRRIPIENENMVTILGRRHCIPPIAHLLTNNHEHKILLKALDCIQRLCLSQTFNSCRRNQTIFQKASGLTQLLNLIRKTNKERLIQAKAITTFACALFDHRENQEALPKGTVQQLFKRIASLLNSTDEYVQIEAGIGLVTFVCNNENYFNMCSENISLDREHFQLLLKSKDASIRCNAAFQMIILIRQIPNMNATEGFAQALMTLFRVIADGHMNDETRILATDIIGRLARIPTGFGLHKHSGVSEAIITSNGLEHIIDLLNSPNIVLHGIACVTLECLVRKSPEGQRRLLKQCRHNINYLPILQRYIFEESSLKAKFDELDVLLKSGYVHLPPIRTARETRTLSIK